MYKMVGQEIKSSKVHSFKRSAQVITMAKDKVKQQAGKLQVFDPQDLFNKLILLALVLTSGGGDGLPISLTKIINHGICTLSVPRQPIRD